MVHIFLKLVLTCILRFNTGKDIYDYLLFIPSDVEYAPNLLERLLSWDKDTISPMFWIGANSDLTHANGLRFYDVWGFVKDGQSWHPYGPAWYAAHYPDEPVQMDTTGGVMLYRAEIARKGARYTPERVDHGLCIAAQEMGYTCWADPTTHVVHGPR